MLSKSTGSLLLSVLRISLMSRPFSKEVPGVFPFVSGPKPCWIGAELERFNSLSIFASEEEMLAAVPHASEVNVPTIGFKNSQILV
jgi:hypothetical protein